jgi:hypothetical protein
MITAEGAGGSLGLGLPLKIFLSIVVVGGIFSIIDDELEYLLGDLFSNSIVPLTLLVVLTLLIIFFELRILQIGMKYYKEKQQLLLEVNAENISEYGRSKVHKQKFNFTLFLFVLIKWILLIVCFVIGYSFILGSDLINFSDILNDKSEETLGTGLFTWLFGIGPLYHCNKEPVPIFHFSPIGNTGPVSVFLFDPSETVTFRNNCNINWAAYGFQIRRHFHFV